MTTSEKVIKNKLGFSAEQVRNSEKHLPRWVRFYDNGMVGESPFTD